MEELIARRKQLKGKLTRLKNKVDEDTARDWDVDTTTMYDEQIDALRGEFDVLYDDILATCTTDEESNHQRQYDESADRCDEVKLALKRIFRGLLGVRQPVTNRIQPRDQNARNEVTTKLPKLDIPKFSGNLLEWTTFYDLFKSNVHNHPSLDGAQKLQYLKSFLIGSAADYDEAWATLQKRYRNTRELVRTQLVRFVEMPCMKTESGVELTSLVDIATSVNRALKALNRPFSDECDLAMYVITHRLDNETHKLWEAHIGCEKMPKLSELLDFLDDRAAILNSTELGKQKVQVSQIKPNNVVYNNKKTVHAHQVSSSKTCGICTNENHAIYACKKFLDMTIIERREKAKLHGLCYNCLRVGHIITKCTSESKCKKCQQRHHTLLHIDHSQPTATVTPKSGTVSAHMSINKAKESRALLCTALVKVTDAFGQDQFYRALIDPGADVSFVSERCIQQLGLKRRRTAVKFSGLGDAIF